MCICEGLVTQTSLECTVIIYQVSKSHRFYVFNFLQRDVINEICRIEVHTGTPNILCLTTTTIICVVVQYLWSNGHRKLDQSDGLYQDFSDLTCLSSVNVIESQRYGVDKSVQIPHPYSVSQMFPSYVYLCRTRWIGTQKSLEFTVTLIQGLVIS